ncbi:hypothetical protein LY76DRAFT_366466 [Colletotrichum caudatum]|nr:hypothetical protein LY76DRAFT_366466 [Colletotrichum caudatum]
MSKSCAPPHSPFSAQPKDVAVLDWRLSRGRVCTVTCSALAPSYAQHTLSDHRDRKPWVELFSSRFLSVPSQGPRVALRALALHFHDLPALDPSRNWPHSPRIFVPPPKNASQGDTLHVWFTVRGAFAVFARLIASQAKESRMEPGV